VNALRAVARDEVFLYPSATRLLLRTCQQAREPHAESPLERLSEREREVLALTAEGYSSAEVGRKLFFSPRTVDTYRARLMQKLGLSHRAELVRLALDTGVLA
jgi:DNA-binding NarL/FixJ family response regulator